MGLFDSFSQDQPQAPTGGLLGQGFADPRSAAIMNLAGSMIRGDFGGGLIGANKGFQDAANANLQRADVAQQIGLRNIQLQQAMQQWKMMQPILQQVSNELGGAPAGTPAQPAQPAIAPESGGQLGSGTFGIPTGGQPAASAPTPQGNAFSGGGGSVMGLPRSVALTSLAFGGPGKFADAVTQYNTPTDLMKTMRAAGIAEGSPLWNQTLQGNIAKGNYIAPVNARPGSIIRDPLNPSKVLAFNPHIPEGGVPQFDGGGNVSSIAPLPGATSVMQAGARATEAGKGDVTPFTGVDAAGNPLPVTNRTAVATQGQPTVAVPAAAPVSVRPQPGDADRGAIYAGEIAKTQDMIANPRNYMTPNMLMQDPTGAQFVSRAKNDLAALKSEAARLAPQGQAPAGGAVYATPPLGTVTNADASQKASADTMKDSYTKLQSTGTTASSALDALDKMMGLAAKKNSLLTVGPLGTHQSAVNPDAAEYEKQRANVIALISQQLGAGGTDAGRANIGESVPDFGKPKEAIADGLGTLRNQLVAQQLKRTLLTPIYQSGDSKKYTTLENQFDQNVSPNLVPLLTMPSGPQRAAALKAASANPAMRARLNWAAENGLLK